MTDQNCDPSPYSYEEEKMIVAGMEYEEQQKILSEIAKYPSFKKIYGRDAVAGVDYDPNQDWCQDDYEFYTGTGSYSDIGECDDADYENDVPMDGDAESALASCGWGTDEDYGYYGEE